MKTITSSFVLCLLIPFLTGCAYVNDSRLYFLRPSVPQDQAQQIAKIVEGQAVQRGLVLKTRFRDTYPEDIAVSVFEIPRRPDEKRRDALFIVYIRSGNLVELKHSEWWLNTSNRPRDYIKDIAPDLISAVRSKFGFDIELVVAKEELYK